MKQFVVLLCLFGIAGSAHGSDSGGTELLQNCTAAVRFLDSQKLDNFEQAHDASFCLGLIQGVVNTNQLYQVVAKDDSLFCVPPTGINNEQGARIVVKYLRDNPSQLHRRDSFLVVAAMRDAFPCKDESHER